MSSSPKYTQYRLLEEEEQLVSAYLRRGSAEENNNPRAKGKRSRSHRLAT